MEKHNDQRELALIPPHALEAAVSLGMSMPPDVLSRLLTSRVGRNLKYAMKVIQQERTKWIVPCVIPVTVWSSETCCWAVLAEPTDRKTITDFRFVLLTLLHENSPVVRKHWPWEGVESPVMGFIAHQKETQDAE